MLVLMLNATNEFPILLGAAARLPLEIQITI